MDEMDIIIDENGLLRDEQVWTMGCTILNIQKSIAPED
jgi:hypothetical protein